MDLDHDIKPPTAMNSLYNSEFIDAAHSPTSDLRDPVPVSGSPSVSVLSASCTKAALASSSASVPVCVDYSCL